MWGFNPPEHTPKQRFQLATKCLRLCWYPYLNKSLLTSWGLEVKRCVFFPGSNVECPQTVKFGFHFGVGFGFACFAHSQKINSATVCFISILPIFLKIIIPIVY